MVTAACSTRAERPQRTSGHQVITCTWHCDRARRGESEACSGGRCGRRRDEVGRITWCFAVQATVNSHVQLVLNTLLDRKPMMITKQTSDVVLPGRAGDQTNGRVENGLQALNVVVGETSEYNVTVVEPTVYQGGDQSGQCVCRQRPLDGFDVPQSHGRHQRGGRGGAAAPMPYTLPPAAPPPPGVVR